MVHKLYLFLQCENLWISSCYFHCLFWMSERTAHLLWPSSPHVSAVRVSFASTYYCSLLLLYTLRWGGSATHLSSLSKKLIALGESVGLVFFFFCKLGWREREWNRLCPHACLRASQRAAWVPEHVSAILRLRKKPSLLTHVAMVTDAQQAVVVSFNRTGFENLRGKYAFM